MTSNNDKAVKTVAVVGASSGFGHGSALELGENVVLTARRTNLLDEPVSEISKLVGPQLLSRHQVPRPKEIWPANRRLR